MICGDVEVIRALTAMCSNKANFKWHDKEQKAFEGIKAIISRETLFAYLDFSKDFHIYKIPVNTNWVQSSCKMNSHWHPSAEIK